MGALSLEDKCIPFMIGICGLAAPLIRTGWGGKGCKAMESGKRLIRFGEVILKERLGVRTSGLVPPLHWERTQFLKE